MVRASGHEPLFHVTTWTYEEPCSGSATPLPETHLTLMALKSPSVPGPPWIGIFTPFRVANWNWPSGASIGIFAAARSFNASPNDLCTCGLSVLSVFGVWTGSAGSNWFLHTDGPGAGEAGFAVARSQKRRNRSAPREVVFSRLSQAASTSQARPTVTGPFELGALPPKELHI